MAETLTPIPRTLIGEMVERYERALHEGSTPPPNPSAAVRDFAKFCDTHLAENRIQRTAARDDNLELLLKDGTTVLVLPPTPADRAGQGEMQKSNYRPVTDG